MKSDNKGGKSSYSGVKIYRRIILSKRRNNWFIIKKTINLQQYSGNKEIHIKN